MQVHSEREEDARRQNHANRGYLQHAQDFKADLVPVAGAEVTWSFNCM
jgi:hypothetical protein